ncbi:MAG TPA: PorV/PorQ family protein [Elusimicrobiales bacterium]|nr:PorV/PorQ family protein [Elusimicrobiales bacterium]
MNWKISRLAAILLAAAPAALSASGAGTTAAPFLKEVPTARGFALGGVYLPLVNEAGAFWSNPAALGAMSGHHIELSAWRGLDAESEYGYLGAALDAGRVGAFGLSYQSYDSGAEEIWDLNGNMSKISLQKDYAVTAGWGRNFGENLFFGASAKTVNSKLVETYSAGAVSFDAGLIYRSLDDKFVIGASARNISGELKYKSEADPLPKTLCGEAGYRFNAGRNQIALGGLIQKPDDADNLEGGAGMEISPAGMPVALRAGLARTADETAFTAGLGLDIGRFGVDYGFKPAGALGETSQRLTLRMDFGSSGDAARAEAFRERGLKRKALAMGYTYAGPRITVSVLQPEIGEGVTAEEGAAVAEALRSGMGRSPKLQLVAREKTEQILREQHFQYSVCGSADCAVEAGKLLGVRKIIGVSMMRIGSRYALTIKSIDVETGAQDYSVTETAGSVEGLYNQAVKFAEKAALEE